MGNERSEPLLLQIFQDPEDFLKDNYKYLTSHLYVTVKLNCLREGNRQTSRVLKNIQVNLQQTQLQGIHTIIQDF